MSNLNTGRIAKNTLMLYVRMFLIMGVSLYTSRVVLDVLGIQDYGIYSLIAGLLTMFSFISQSLVESMQRFFNVALGKKDIPQTSSIYMMGINIFVIFSLFLFLVGETLGLWYLNNYLNVPDGREQAAFWVYQISLVTLVIQLFRTPDNALIIAHERMSFYAYLSILETLLKLGIVFLLQLSSHDRLIFYTLLYGAASVLINLIYRLYCRRQFKEVRFRFYWDNGLFKEMMSFSGWTVLNGGSRTVTMQFENIFLNRFYSVSVNAARGVAAQVYNAINLFITNFQTAFRPQLVKTYAAQEWDEHERLLYQSSRFSFYLFLVIVIPIIFNLNVMLSIWLVEVPEYTMQFCVYVLLAYLTDALAHPLTTSIMANGNIKGIQITTSLVFFAQLAASFFALRSGAAPYIVSIFILVSHSIHYLLYIYYAKKLCRLNLQAYLKHVILPVIIVSLVSLPLPYFLRSYSHDFLSAAGLVLFDAICVIAAVWGLGMDKHERTFVLSWVSGAFKHSV